MNDISKVAVLERELPLSAPAAPDLPPFAAWLVTRPDLWCAGSAAQQQVFRQLHRGQTGL